MIVKALIILSHSRFIFCLNTVVLYNLFGFSFFPRRPESDMCQKCSRIAQWPKEILLAAIPSESFNTSTTDCCYECFLFVSIIFTFWQVQCSLYNDVTKLVWKRTLHPKWFVSEPEVWVVFLSSDYLLPRTKNKKTFFCRLKLVVRQVKHTMTFQAIQVLATHVQKYFRAYLS